MRPTSFVTAVLTAASAIAVVALGPSAEAAFPGPNGRIVFVSNLEGNNEIYTMNPDGSDVRRLTENTFNDIEPAWSADGTKIAFVSNRPSLTDGSEDNEIYVMNADGTGVTQVTDDPNFERNPAFAPDNFSIVFSRLNQIFITGLEGGEEQLTELGSNVHPVVSPSGGRIAFASDRHGNFEIHTMNLDGTSPLRHTADPVGNEATDLRPDWSPDGSKIVFQRDGTTSDIWVVGTGIGGTPPVNLTNDAFPDAAPVFSPDGTKIAFIREVTSLPGAVNEIVIIPAAGGAAVNPSNESTSENTPDWQPAPAEPPGPPAVADFDGDGDTDLSVYRDGAWYVDGQPPVFFGLPGYIAVAGDYDDDRNSDPAVYRDGAWYAEGQETVYFGLAGDIPVPGNYDGDVDGQTEHAVYRDGIWYVNGQAPVYFGLPGDIPVPGDYDGDGDTDRAVYRDGAWYVEGQAAVFLGLPGDIPVPGDYDGDGNTERAVYRDGIWYVEGQSQAYLGLAGYIPVPLPHAIYSRFFP